MSAIAPTPLPPAPVPRRFSLADFERMIDAGILMEDDDVELLRGRIVHKMPRNPIHDAVIARAINRQLGPRLPAGWHCRGQSAIALAGSDSRPEPDIAVARGDELDYVARPPLPTELALVIEVAGTSLHHDRTEKLSVYAQEAIPVYWIIDLAARQVEVCTDPTGPADEPTYRHRQDYSLADDIPLILAGREVARVPVRDLLP